MPRLAQLESPRPGAAPGYGPGRAQAPGRRPAEGRAGSGLGKRPMRCGDGPSSMSGHGSRGCRPQPAVAEAAPPAHSDPGPPGPPASPRPRALPRQPPFRGPSLRAVAWRCGCTATHQPPWQRWAAATAALRHGGPARPGRNPFRLGVPKPIENVALSAK